MSPAKQLMDEFAAEAKRMKQAGRFEEGMVYDNAESLVNNVMHGEAFEPVATRVRAALLSNSAHKVNNPVEQQTYLDAIELLDTFVAIRASERGA